MHNWGTVTFFKLYGISTAVHRLSLAAASGGWSSLRYVGSSWRWLLWLLRVGSRWMGFSTRVVRAQLPFAVWDPPRPGIEPVSLAFAGGFLTAGPPGKRRTAASELFSLHAINRFWIMYKFFGVLNYVHVLLQSLIPQILYYIMEQ